jgi:DMSO/TMAO reductase YedYZ molybdopterin-dependent catalytic subunit
MALLRWTLQVRSVPERMLEWSLLLVPPGFVEASLRRFGFDTKRYALYLAVLCTVVALAAVGGIVLARRWSAHALLALGAGLWLIVMLAVLPLTGAGVFGSELIDGMWNVVVGYLAVALTYSGALLLVGVLLGSGDASPAREDSGPLYRRTALISIGGAIASLLATFVVQRATAPDLANVRVFDPQEPLPSGGLDPAQSHPESVSPPGQVDQSVATAEPAVAHAATASTQTVFPEPRPARPMKRDKDGGVVPSGRREGELTDLITSNDDFYVVTKNAAGDPVLSAENWRLRVDGAVTRSIELDYAGLRKLPTVEVVRTLECISNFAAKCELAPFGCDLISTARWRGVRLSSLLELAGGVNSDATFVAALSADEYTSGLPLDAVMHPEAVLAYEMNGEVLPREHGYPVRLLIPDRYGMKNAKWVVGLRVMRREFIDWYGQRNWNKDGTVQTIARIDLPPPATEFAPGDYNIAGIAYAGARGIDRVEFSTDSGETWHTADFLEPPVARDMWVRWIARFSLPSDAHLTLMARAYDGTGVLQPQAFSLPEPDGSTGWPMLEVQARQG